MTFANPLPWWALVAGLAASVWLSWRGTAAREDELPAWQRAALSALRLAIVVLIVALVMRPVRVDPSGAATVRLAVVVDRSASMGLTDGSGTSRFDAAVAIVRQLTPALPARVGVEAFTLGTRLEQAAFDQTRADAGRVELATALRDLRSRVPPFAAVLLLSDGALEIDEALGRDMPISVVPVGTKRRDPDRGVIAVSAGEPIAPDESVDLSVTVVQQASPNEPFDVRVAADGSPVETRRVTTPASGVPAHVLFRVAPAGDRPTTFTVEVPPLAGEITEMNNRASVVVAPPGEPRRVLVIEGGPGHEHSFLKRAWLSDPGLLVDAVVRKGATDTGAPAYYLQTAGEGAADLTGGFPATLASLCRYDVVVLANAGADTLTRQHLERLAYFVTLRGGGLVVLGRGTFDTRAWRDTPLDALLPLDSTTAWSGASAGSAGAGGVTLLEAGAAHPLMRLGGDAEQTRAKWSGLPGLGEVFSYGGPRPGARVLAVTPAAGGVQLPLVAIQNFGRGRVLAFTGEASWRWKMQMPSTDRTFETFWRQAVRWAAARHGPVAVSMLKRDDGRTVVRVSVRNAEFTPVEDADVRVTVARPGGMPRDDRAVPVAPDAGVYETLRDIDVPGPLRVSASATRQGDTLGADTTWWAAPLDSERMSPWRDDGVLRRLAERAGGRVLAPSEVSGWAAGLGAAQLPASPASPDDVWHQRWVLLVAVVLLSTEWALRRHWGLR